MAWGDDLEGEAGITATTDAASPSRASGTRRKFPGLTGSEGDRGRCSDSFALLTATAL